MKKIIIISAVLSLASLIGREGEGQHHSQHQGQHHQQAQHHYNNNYHHNDYHHNMNNEFNRRNVNPNINVPNQGSGSGQVIVVPDDSLDGGQTNQNQNPTGPQQ